MDRKPSQARDRILGTAQELFYAQGVRATGIDLIIAQSGVAKMTFYKHFPSKQDLVVEVLRRREEQNAENFRAFMAKIPTPRARLLGVFDFLAHWFKQPSFRGCASINATVESADAEAPECAVAQAHKKSLLKFLEVTSREAGFGAAQSKDLARKLLLLFDGAIVRAQMDGGTQPAATARAIAELVIDAA